MPRARADCGAAIGVDDQGGVIGGMVETGFWQAVAERYQAARGNKSEVVARGQPLFFPVSVP